MASSANAPRPSRENFRWDVFLSYAHADRDSVEKIAIKLRAMELKVWWDGWEVPPGGNVQDELWKGLKGSWATVIFIGPATMGHWQNIEVKTAIHGQVKEGRPVIPAFLPGVADPDKFDLDIPFLGLNSRLVFEGSLDDERVFDRMSWGITGINPNRTKPETPALKPLAEVDVEAIDEALEWLLSWLKTGNVTFFVGPSAAAGGPECPPRNWEIARKLLGEMNLIQANDIKMLPPMEVAAMLFAVSKTDPVLEATVVNLIQGRSAAIPSAQQALATLLTRLAKREKTRGRQFQKQLILTTNIDLMIERALLRAGLGFTRVVQHKSESELYVTSYHDLPFVPAEADKLDDLIANADAAALKPEDTAGNRLVEPILFKLRGSQDLSGSCALTRPQLLSQARSVIANHLIPDDLQKIAANTPIVFLGTGLLDSDFQYTSHTVLFKAWDSDHRKYIVQVPPEQDQDDEYRRMEAGIWQKIKQSAMRHNLTTVEERADRFLNRLTGGM